MMVCGFTAMQCEITSMTTYLRDSLQTLGNAGMKKETLDRSPWTLFER